MREPLFIKKNKDRWEQLSATKMADPDDLSNNYLQVMDDLSYAQTFYPNSKTHHFLNERAVGFYNEIYSKRKTSMVRSFIDFWAVELPLAIKENHRQLLYATAFFLSFMLIGIVSAAYESGFLGEIIGQDYVEMTKDNIQRGDPFGVYKDPNYLGMFIRIALNNILLTILLVYATGIFAGIGTLYSLMTNGIMLGSFQYLFFEYGLGWQSILVIWIHGVFEISAIVIAGGAGLAMGNSLLFPGTLSRMNSLKKGAARSAKILVITIVMLLIAAWLESYVTHLSSNFFDNEAKGQAELPAWGSSLILISCTAFICWYFMWLPIKVAKRQIK